MTRTASHITDYDIQALIDNELDHEQAKHIKAQINHSCSLSARYKELLNQKRLIQIWWKKTSQ